MLLSTEFRQAILEIASGKTPPSGLFRFDKKSLCVKVGFDRIVITRDGPSLTVGWYRGAVCLCSDKFPLLDYSGGTLTLEGFHAEMDVLAE